MRIGVSAFGLLLALALPANAAIITSRVETPHSVTIEGLFGSGSDYILVGNFFGPPRRLTFSYTGDVDGEFVLFTRYALNFVDYSSGVREESFVPDCCDLIAAARPDGTIFNDIFPLILSASAQPGLLEFTFRLPPDEVFVSGPPYFEERTSFWEDISVEAFLIEPDEGAFTIHVETIPEPATWAMLILGFGAIGTALRSRRSSTLSHGERIRSLGAASA